MNQIFGYGRVSTREQNPARQREILKSQSDFYYEDKLTGKNMERPQLQKMMEKLRAGDTVKVLSVDRLGRNTRELINTAYELKERGVNVVAVEQGIDTGTPMGQLFYSLMAIFAQLELEFIQERQRAGIEIAKKEGRFKGRPQKQLDGFEHLAKEVEEGSLSVSRACKLMGISRSTYYRRRNCLETGMVNDDDIIVF